MKLGQHIKQHPILSYCVFIMLWSFSWWALILTVVPIGTIMTPPMHPAAIVFMIIGAGGPILAGLTLTRVVDGKGSALALLARLKRWRVGWWWLTLLIPPLLTIVIYILYAQTGGVSLATILQPVVPAIGIGLFAGFFEEMG